MGTTLLPLSPQYPATQPEGIFGSLDVTGCFRRDGLPYGDFYIPRRPGWRLPVGLPGGSVPRDREFRPTLYWATGLAGAQIVCAIKGLYMSQNNHDWLHQSVVGGVSSRPMGGVCQCSRRRAAIDPKPTWRKRQPARSPVLCICRDDQCYAAELYLMRRFFSRLERKRRAL